MTLGIRRITARITFGALILIGAPAAAAVMDISPEGTITVYDRPAFYSGAGVHPLAPRQTFATAPANNGLDALITAAAQRYVLSPILLRAVAWKESHYRSDAVSSKGAVGVMQLMPATAKAMGGNQFDVSQNILGGAAYLRAMLDRYRGDSALALAAYNAGPSAVDRFGAVPPFAETQDYVRAILGEGPTPLQPALPPFILFNQ